MVTTTLMLSPAGLSTTPPANPAGESPKTHETPLSPASGRLALSQG
jgi:hypothetical protein